MNTPLPVVVPDSRFPIPADSQNERESGNGNKYSYLGPIPDSRFPPLGNRRNPLILFRIPDSRRFPYYVRGASWECPSRSAWEGSATFGTRGRY
jgi:hypothetical protein